MEAVETGNTMAVALFDNAIKVTRVLFAQQRIGSQLHDDWRLPRKEEETGRYKVIIFLNIFLKIFFYVRTKIYFFTLCTNFFSFLN